MNLINTITTMEPTHWLIVILACIITAISQLLLSATINWYRENNYVFDIHFKPDIYRPFYPIEVVNYTDDAPLGICSLATINRLLADGETIALYGDLNIPAAKQEIFFDGPVTIKEWVIALRNLQTPATIQLLDELFYLGATREPALRPKGNNKTITTDEQFYQDLSRSFPNIRH